MAIATVNAQTNGQLYNLSKNADTGLWQAPMTAPGATSRNQNGGYYNVLITATNQAGTSAQSDGTILSGLQLFVKETVPPAISILVPSNGAYVTNNKAECTFVLTDESGGSGIDPTSIIIMQDGTKVNASTWTYTATAEENGAPTRIVTVKYTPATSLTDGTHTITVDCKDKDGNSAPQATTQYIVDTVPPALNVSAPPDNYITNLAELTIVGTTNDLTSSPVTVIIQINHGSNIPVVVLDNGSFEHTITLREGASLITVTATDAAGKQSVVEKTVVLDTTVPEIRSAVITPNPADTGATLLLTVEVD